MAPAETAVPRGDLGERQLALDGPGRMVRGSSAPVFAAEEEEPGAWTWYYRLLPKAIVPAGLGRMVKRAELDLACRAPRKASYDAMVQSLGLRRRGAKRRQAEVQARCRRLRTNLCTPGCACAAVLALVDW